MRLAISALVVGGLLVFSGRAVAREVAMAGWVPVRHDWRVWLASLGVLVGIVCAVSTSVVAGLYDLALSVILMGSGSWSRLFKLKRAERAAQQAREDAEVRASARQAFRSPPEA
jgi:hypothetical protein